MGDLKGWLVMMTAVLVGVLLALWIHTGELVR